jgi:hypothetical protein
MSDKLQALIMHQYWRFCLTRSNVTIFKSGCFLVRKAFEMWPWERQHVSPAIFEVSQDWSPQLELKTMCALVLSPEENELVWFTNTVWGVASSSTAGKKAIKPDSGNCVRWWCEQFEYIWICWKHKSGITVCVWKPTYLLLSMIHHKYPARSTWFHRIFRRIGINFFSKGLL